MHTHDMSVVFYYFCYFFWDTFPEGEKLSSMARDLLLEEEKEEEEDPATTTTTTTISAPIRHIYTGKTPSHVDHDKEGNVVEERVVFMFLNDNPDATFTYGDDYSDVDALVKVPVVAGTLVSFMGNIHHHTIVSSGQVNLLGPFRITEKKENIMMGNDDNDDGTITILESVGELPCSSDCDCPEGLFCNCDSRRQLVSSLERTGNEEGNNDEEGRVVTVRGSSRRRLSSKKSSGKAMKKSKSCKKGGEDVCPNGGWCDWP